MKYREKQKLGFNNYVSKAKDLDNFLSKCSNIELENEFYYEQQYKSNQKEKEK